MSRAVELLEELERLGVGVTLTAAGRVHLEPDNLVPEALWPELVAHRDELARLLAHRVPPVERELRSQACADAFERLAVMYQVLSEPRPTPQPAEADSLWDRLAVASELPDQAPFEDALAAFVSVVERHFAHHLVSVCQVAGISLEAVTAEDGELVLRARLTEGTPVQEGLGRALRVLRSPLLEILPDRSRATRRRASR